MDTQQPIMDILPYQRLPLHNCQPEVEYLLAMEVEHQPAEHHYDLKRPVHPAPGFSLLSPFANISKVCILTQKIAAGLLFSQATLWP